jgi:hypothetical protein
MTLPPGRQLVAVPPDAEWSWSADVRAGMLFTIDGSYLRVGTRRGPRGAYTPDVPDADDVLRLCRASGAGREVCMVVDDPATAGWLMERRRRLFAS